MRSKQLHSIWVGVLFLGLLSSAAFATPEEDMANAEKSFNEEDIKESARFLRLAAAQNYFPAQVRIGELMDRSEEPEEAFGWFFTAAFQGDAAGQYQVALMYGIGSGVQKSPEKALYWAKKSAEQDYLASVQLLSSAYSGATDKNGNKVATKNIFDAQPNKEQADFWSAKLPKLEEAAKKNERQALARAKKRAEEAEKANKEKSKLLCGLKC